MGTEETSSAILSRPTLPPKPQVPPKPQPRGTRWRRATDVICSEVAGEDGNQSQMAQKARHKSLPSCPNEQSLCLSVAKDDSPFPQPDGLLSFSERVKPFPLPKPRLQKTPLRQDSKPLPADKERVSSTDSSDSEGRLWDGRSGSEGDSPSSGLGCAPSCPCMCHCSRHPKGGEGPLRMEPHLKAPPSSLPGLCLPAPGLKGDLHWDYWHITCPRAPGRSGRVPPKIPLPARPLPKEPDLISIQDRKEEPDVPEGVYLEMDVSPSEVDDHCTAVVMCNRYLGSPVSPDVGVGAAERLSFSKVPKPLPPVPAKPLPPLRKQSTNKERDKRTCDAPLQSIVAELQEKFPSDGKEVKSRKKSHVKKRENGQKFSLLCKRSPTNVMALSSSQKKKSPLAELVLFSFKSKESAQELQEAALTTQSPTVLASPVREPWVDVTVKDSENLDVSDLSSPATPLGIQACLEQEDDTVAHLAEDNEDTGSTPQGVMRGVSIRGSHRSRKPFWQERTIVQDSGVLTQLSKQQLLLHESMYEVVTTEQSYLDSLNVAVGLFMESSALNQVLAPRDRKSLFSSMGKIREISQNFLDAMQTELEASLFCDVCEIIRLHASEHFGAYVDYIRNMPYQEQTLHNLGKEDPQIKEILTQLQEDPRCHRLPLKSFLVLPFQRITRLKILVETILKRTDPGSDGQASAQQALKEISKVVEACNHEVGRMKQMEELVHIANKTEFECKALPLVSSSRWLVKQGELAHLTDKENIFGKRKVFPVYLFLYNDLLLVTIKKGLDRFVVQDHVHRSLIEISDEVEDAEVECELKNTFLLALLKDHKGKTSQRLLRAPSQAEKASWVEALRPQKNGKNEVYEEWDCPQVQCTADYSAQQPGELSLLIGDVLNVIQKTNDGFLEGRRLVDGERGWFPRGSVKEITNEHVQRRHLRQRYHVLQAANRMLRQRCMSSERHASTCFR
ncbi:ephexin-1 isoform X2 [Anguilla rostrata]